MAEQITRYLRIHFAPSTACVDVPITEHQFLELTKAMGKHDGEVTLEVSSHQKTFMKVTR
jgi:hypothetical protein